jgi:very-short-patch-repair endonuclease
MAEFEITSREFARAQRRNLSTLEHRLWRELRNRRFESRKFRRQVPIGPYVADFACFEARVIVEADGPHHLDAEQKQKDVRRDAWFASQGFTIVRLSGDEIVGNLDAALARVEQALTKSAD